MVLKAVIPAGGYGTRNLPVSKAIPKEMFPICGKPALQYIVEEAAEAGIREILIIVSRGKNAIIDYFDKSFELEHHLQLKGKTQLLRKLPLPSVHIQYVRQPEALGLGTAVRLAKPFVGKEPFALMLPDDLLTGGATVLKRMIRAFEVYKRPILGVRTITDEEQIKNYGVVQGDQVAANLIRINGIVEKPVDKPPSNLAVIGRYVLPAEIFSFINLDKKGAGGEVQLTDALQEWLQTADMYGMDILEPCYDISKTEEYIKLQQFYYNQQEDRR
ncbi:UTP--glucose-1-phosphate uridylyltransferase [Paenibacillaceae bacterium WGS1546]|uniref:UTP--glucose-1-phosphate uridylyltransferase n=1 Tax=Cohnella sp. WGS1546 TaxID=3366810 RepID=UPI00372D0DD8